MFDDRFGREGVTDEEIAQVRIERGPHFFAVLPPIFHMTSYSSYKVFRPKLAAGKGW